MNGYDIAMTLLEKRVLGEIRSEIIPRAHGDVLEAGIGTGVNCKYYNYADIRSLTGIDREYSPELKRRAPTGFSFVPGSVEEMPFAENRFDCVVATLLFCSVDAAKGIGEVRRVLKPGGMFIFIEHVRPTGPLAGKLFDVLNGAWPHIANGCNLNRRTDAVLRQSGFSDLVIRKSGGVFCYGTARNSVGAV